MGRIMEQFQIDSCVVSQQASLSKETIQWVTNKMEQQIMSLSSIIEP